MTKRLTTVTTTTDRSSDLKTNRGAPREIVMEKTLLLKRASAGAAALACATVILMSSLPGRLSAQAQTDDATNKVALLAEGKKTFRFETFGDEDFWGGVLKLHQVIAGAKLGGVGQGLSPKTAAALGLKADIDALPDDLVTQIKAGAVNLDDPATTLGLLRLNAVVGVTGIFEGNKLKSMGIQCAICHSTVDQSFTAPGLPAGIIGHRLDGWANRDINMGAIAAQSPDLSPVANLLGVDQATVRKVLNSWGPGKFDAEVFMDGQAFRPDGKPAATLIPPAFGLAGVNLNTWTGWGTVTYWNALVANLEMHGKGRFADPRLNDATQFPIAAKNNFGNVNPDIDPDDDRVTSKLGGLHAYQLSLAAPRMPAQPFNFPAQRGDKLFSGKAKCNSCHAEPLWTEPGMNLHKGADVCIDDFQANRSPAKMYRTAPLGGLFTHQKGGFYHDGRFATLNDVVEHYDSCMKLGLTGEEKSDLIAYLLTL